VSRRVSSPDLIGRAAERAALVAALREARHGRGRLVLVEGDAGIGKTRLVEAFLSGAGGVEVITAGGIPLAADAPYAPMVDVFASLARLHPPAAGSLALHEPTGRVDPFGGTRLLGATVAAVRAVAARTPLVLVVEDLHWADASSRDLVAFLSRAIRADPVLMVVTVRTEELDPSRPVGMLVGELTRLPHAQRLDLRPLSAIEVGAQVRAITGVHPSAQLLDRLVSRAAGNPFFTEELLAAGADAGALPASVRDVVLSRVARLSEPGRRVVQAGAVLGRFLAHDVLARVAAADDLRDGLDTVVRHRLLEVREDGYVFRHPLIQEAVYSDLLPDARRALHARAAAALVSRHPRSPATPADRAGHAVQVAFHWRAADQMENALAAGVRAADLAMAAHAPADALAQYTQAMDLWNAAPDPARVAGIDEIDLAERAAEAASAAGENARAKELGRQVLRQLDPAAEPVRVALRHERLGWFSWLAGDQASSWQAYEEALRIIPEEPSPAYARVLAGTAQSLMLRSRHLASRDYAGRAVTVAQAVGARAEEAHARDTLGIDLAETGHHADGIAMVERGLLIAREIGDAAEVARCQVNRTELLVGARRLDEALRVGEEGVREAMALGFERIYAAALLGAVLTAMYLRGDWDEIETRSAVALDRAPEAWSTLPLRIPRCRLALDRGDVARATRELEAMSVVPGAADDTQFGPVLASLEAALAGARGDLAAARQAVDRALALVAATDDLGAHLEIAAVAIRIEADAVEVARRSGRRPDPVARERAARGLASAHQALDRVAAAGGRASEVFGLLDACARAEYTRLDPAGADGGGMDAAERWDLVASSDLADPHLVARARHRQAAALLAGRRSRAAATDALRTADRIARQLAASPLVANVATLARHARIDLGSAVPAGGAGRGEPDPYGLTGREREVVVLVRDGLSNAQIARTLFISEKTASVHVSNILRKLGVTSRVQAAAAAGRYRGPDG
jgi:DNA-binding NarL/FixJ family response regulator